MFHRHVEFYLHIIWSTWDRKPWIEAAIQPRLHAAIAAIAKNEGCPFVVVGGVSEHVHVLVRAPPTTRPSDLIRLLKGASSHLAHTGLGVDPSCGWSEGYALFSVDRGDVTELTDYVSEQARHHATGTTDPRREQPA